MDPRCDGLGGSDPLPLLAVSSCPALIRLAGPRGPGDPAAAGTVNGMVFVELGKITREVQRWTWEEAFCRRLRFKLFAMSIRPSGSDGAPVLKRRAKLSIIIQLYIVYSICISGVPDATSVLQAACTVFIEQSG